MSKNSVTAKTEESKVDPVVQPSESEEGNAQHIKVRVLTLCQLGVANDVTLVPKGSLPGLKSLGYVDEHPDAVAYAQSLKVSKA